MEHSRREELIAEALFSGELYEEEREAIKDLREEARRLRVAICIYCREETVNDWKDDDQAIEWFCRRNSEEKYDLPPTGPISNTFNKG